MELLIHEVLLEFLPQHPPDLLNICIETGKTSKIMEFLIRAIQCLGLIIILLIHMHQQGIMQVNQHMAQFFISSLAMTKPKHGNFTQDGIPWTGGGQSGWSAAQVPASPDCYRFPPGLNSKKIYSACVKPLPTKYHREQDRYK